MSVKDQRVLTGYAIKMNIDGMAFDEVWDVTNVSKPILVWGPYLSQ